LRRVYSSFNLQVVHHQKNLLETAGIRAIVKNEILSSAMGELPPAECQAELWVDDADLTRAEQILSEKETQGSRWTCTCGEALEPQFSHCWRCGALRPN